MPNLDAIQFTLTNHTCGIACWYARENICRCSCGGVNHGVLLVEGAEQPARQRKVKSQRYELEAVVEGWLDARNYCRELGVIDPTVASWRYTQPELIMQSATKAQVTKWRELESFDANDRPYLIWREIK